MSIPPLTATTSTPPLTAASTYADLPDWAGAAHEARRRWPLLLASDIAAAGARIFAPHHPDAIMAGAWPHVHRALPGPDGATIVGLFALANARRKRDNGMVSLHLAARAFGLAVGGADGNEGDVLKPYASRGSC